MQHPARCSRYLRDPFPIHSTWPGHHVHSFTKALPLWQSDPVSSVIVMTPPHIRKKPASILYVLQLCSELPWLPSARSLDRISIKVYGLHDECNCLSAFQQKCQPIPNDSRVLLQSCHLADRTLSDAITVLDICF